MKSRFAALSIALFLFTNFACNLKSQQRGLPSEVEEAIRNISEDLASENYEKVYNEASDLWRQDSTLEQSTAVLKTLRTKLGKVISRNLNSATEQRNTSGPLAGHVYIVSYQTKFENADGMETFALVERNHQWQLARYSVYSTALK